MAFGNICLNAASGQNTLDALRPARLGLGHVQFCSSTFFRIHCPLAARPTPSANDSSWTVADFRLRPERDSRPARYRSFEAAEAGMNTTG